MKNPKALFPFLFASSWFGTLVLTVLAFHLAFTHAGPLTPLTFLTLALCILSGNALPLCAYLIQERWREAELRAEAAEAELRVRDALKRAEEIIGRLDEAEGALAKGVLVARQVPERIEESFKPLLSLSEKFATLELSSFSEALQKPVDRMEAGLKQMRKDLTEVPGKLEKLLGEIQTRTRGEEGDEADVSLGERLDLVFETLETVQDSLDGLLQRVAEIKLPAPESAPAPSTPPPFAEQTTAGEVREAVAGKRQEAVVEGEEKPEPPMAVKRPKAKRKTDAAQEEMQLGGEEAETVPEGDGKTRLIAHAMVGISNKLYIRGDEPWLSWDDGIPMELIGIGEYAWTTDDLKEPIAVCVLLNDETPCEEGNVRLEPGGTVHLTPRFPK